jgi:uncharacterized RDD family membrane protein YckC
MTEGTIGEGRQTRQPMEFAGFWRRIGAALIDTFILGAIGWAIALLFSDQLSQFGDQARFIGFPIAIAYFALGNSRTCGGTPGKHALGIHVTSRDGAAISIRRSLLRAVVYLIPLYANGYDFSFLQQHAFLSTLVSAVQAFLVFGVLFGTVYLYLANWRTRQVIHDLAAGTFVVRKSNTPWRIDEHINSKHLIVISALFLLSIAIVPVEKAIPNLEQRLIGSDFGALTNIQSTLNREGDVLSTGVQINTSNNFQPNGQKKVTTALIVTVVHRGRPDMPEAFANQVAARVLKLYPDALGRQQLMIVVRYGFDIGISSKWTSDPYSFTPDQWRARLKQP